MVKEMEEEHSDMCHKLATLHEKDTLLASLQDQIREMDASLEKKHADYESKTAKLETEVEDLTFALSEEQTKVTVLEMKLAQLETELSMQVGKLQQDHSDPLVETSVDVAQLQHMQEKYVASMNEKDTELANKQRTLEQLETRCRQLELELADKNALSNVGDSEAALNKLQGAHIVLEQELVEKDAVLVEKFDELEKCLVHLEKEQAKNEELEVQQGILAVQLAEKIALLEARAEACEDESCAKMEQELLEQQALVGALKEKASALELELANVRQKLLDCEFQGAVNGLEDDLLTDATEMVEEQVQFMSA